MARWLCLFEELDFKCASVLGRWGGEYTSRDENLDGPRVALMKLAVLCWTLQRMFINS